MDYSNFEITVGPKKKAIKLCIDEVEKQNVNDNVQNNHVDLNGHIFKYNGNMIDILFDEQNKPWFKGIDLARVLNYKDGRRAIFSIVSDKNKKRLKDLKQGNLPLFDSKGENFTPLKKSNNRNIGSTFYINESGIYEFLIKSDMKEAKQFQKWITDDVLPSINKKGYYSAIPIEDIKETHIVFDGNSNEYVDYCISNTVSDLAKCRIIYLGYVGVAKYIPDYYDTNIKVGDQVFKYGTTFRGWIRGDEHSRQFRNFTNYCTFFVQKSIMNDQIEIDLEEELKRNGLIKHCKVGKNTYTELFITSDTFTIADIKTFIENLAQKFSDQMVSNAVLLEQEKTKQEIEKTKQKEFEFKMRDIELQLLLHSKKGDTINDCKKV